jgi:organic hydroperoxide reductase OsmC/OhrA
MATRGATAEWRGISRAEGQFAGYGQQAKEGCPVSRALAGVSEITLDARLV